MDIRNYVINNFKNCSKNEIKETIIESIKSNEEVVLPGMGVLFEIIWNNKNLQTDIIDTIFNKVN